MLEGGIVSPTLLDPLEEEVVFGLPGWKIAAAPMALHTP
jgi:hypothetical protein